MRQSCSACLMPYSMDTGTRTNSDYCSYCQREDGTFAFSGTRSEFQTMCYRAMRQKGIAPWKARFFTWMIRFAPQWKSPGAPRDERAKNGRNI